MKILANSATHIGSVGGKIVKKPFYEINVPRNCGTVGFRTTRSDRKIADSERLLVHRIGRFCPTQ